MSTVTAFSNRVSRKPIQVEEVTNISSMPIPWKEWKEMFMLHKKAEGIAPRTIFDYNYHIDRFFEKTNPTFDGLKLAVMKYFAESANLAPATYNTQLRKLKPFFSYCLDEGLIKSDPIAGIKKQKEDENPKAVSANILKDLLKLPDVRFYVGLRDYAAFLLTLDCGIRPSELFALKIEDVDLKTLTVNIPAAISKTRTSASLPIEAITGETIKKLISNRNPVWKKDVPLFCTENGKAVTNRSWNRRLEIYSKQLDVKVTPYQLRHSFATEYLKNSGGDVFSLKRMLRHSTFTMTNRYLKITESDLQKSHSKASPLNNLITGNQRVNRKIR